MSTKNLFTACLCIFGTALGSHSFAQTIHSSHLGHAALATIGQRGISTRFVGIQAIEGQDLKVYVEVIDGLKVIQKVSVFCRISGQEKRREYQAQRVASNPREREQTWFAIVPAKHLPPALGSIELSAHLLTKRGGLVLTLGEPEPFDTQVLSKERARKEKAVFQQLNQELQGDFGFVGGIGLEAKAASAARIRAVLSGSGKVSHRWDLSLKVSVGPSGLAPQTLRTLSPVVLGFEISGRRRVPSKSILGFDVFSEFFSSLDLSLPGADGHLGLRFGGSHALGGTARIDVGLGGGLGWFKIDQAQPIFGFTGGLQSIVWFGDTDKSIKEN